MAEFIQLKGGEISYDLSNDLLAQSLGGASVISQRKILKVMGDEADMHLHFWGD